MFGLIQFASAEVHINYGGTNKVEITSYDKIALFADQEIKGAIIPFPTGVGIQTKEQCELMPDYHWIEDGCYYCQGGIYKINQTYKCINCPLGWEVDRETGECAIMIKKFGLFFLFIFIFIFFTVNGNLRVKKAKRLIDEQLNRSNIGLNKAKQSIEEQLKENHLWTKKIRKLLAQKVEEIESNNKP